MLRRGLWALYSPRASKNSTIRPRASALIGSNHGPFLAAAEPQSVLCSVKEIAQTLRALLELSFVHNQADHQEAIAWEIEEMPRVHQPITGFSQRDREIP